MEIERNAVGLWNNFRFRYADDDLVLFVITFCIAGYPAELFSPNLWVAAGLPKSNESSHGELGPSQEYGGYFLAFGHDSYHV